MTPAFSSISPMRAAGRGRGILNDAGAQGGGSDWPKGRRTLMPRWPGVLLAMIFEKNSTPDRVSFDMAMRPAGRQARW